MSPRTVFYAVRFSPAGQAEYARLAPIPRRAAKEYRTQLSFGPHMPESKQLELLDQDDLWRIKFGDWRIVFRLDDANREIEIIRVRRRAEACIGLERPPRH